MFDNANGLSDGSGLIFSYFLPQSPHFFLVLLQLFLSVGIKHVLFPVIEHSEHLVCPLPIVDVGVLYQLAGLAVEDDVEGVGDLVEVIDVCIFVVLLVSHHLSEVAVVAVAQFFIILKEFESLEQIYDPVDLDLTPLCWRFLQYYSDGGFFEDVEQRLANPIFNLNSLALGQDDLPDCIYILFFSLFILLFLLPDLLKTSCT